MIQETCVQIDELKVRHEAERLARTARRNKIHFIDELLNEFELLNLAEEPQIPLHLRVRVSRLMREERHPLAHRPMEEIRIVEWMDALYDVQDTLMVPLDDELD